MTLATPIRINVIGTSGSGKTTFCRQLAEQLRCPCIEMDYLFWKENWTQPSDMEFYAKLKSALEAEAWVLDGNYTRTVPIKWRTATMVIWLDYSFLRVCTQALKRGVHRAWTKEELWPGTNNRESFWKLFFSRESVLLWSIQTFSSNRRKYNAVFRENQYPHIQFVRLTSPKQSEVFLREMMMRCSD